MQSCLTKDRGSPFHDLWRLRCEPLLHLTSGLSSVGSLGLTASVVSARMAPKGSLCEESGAHSGVGGEWFGAATVEVYTRNVVHDSLGCLDSIFRVGRSDLVDQVGLFYWVGGENGLGLSVVCYDASDG